jgi:5'-3' exonuclease
MDKILLIDGHNAMWRASIGFGPVHAKVSHTVCVGGYDEACNHTVYETHCTCGKPWDMKECKCPAEVNDEFVLIFNFFRNLRPLIEQFAPDKCYFILEGHPQFRYDLFSEYKANRILKTADRKEDLDKFLESKDEIVRLMKYLPVTIARAANYECDDVIGTLCENLKDEDVTVLSGDSDFVQLLQRGYNNCKVYSPIKKSFMDCPDFPYVAWKCLVGDSADNIPGFKGIGDKTAQKMLKDPDKFKKFMSIEENRAKFSVFRQLIELRAVPEDEIELVEGVRNFKELKIEFEKMKFQSITNDTSWNKYTKTFDCIKF